MSSYPFNFKCSYERFPKMQFMSTLHLGALFEFPFCHLISFHYSAVFIPCAGICGATTLVTYLFGTFTAVSFCLLLLWVFWAFKPRAYGLDWSLFFVFHFVRYNVKPINNYLAPWSTDDIVCWSLQGNPGKEADPMLLDECNCFVVIWRREESGESVLYRILFIIVQLCTQHYINSGEPHH